MGTLSEDIAAKYNELLRIALKITGREDDAQDLTQEVYIVMLEYDQEKLKTIYDNGHLGFWCTRVMLNMYIRSNSQFKKKHHEINKTGIDNEYRLNQLICDGNAGIEEKILQEDRLNLINSAMDDLHFYDKTLFKVYYETDHTIRSLAEATGISTTSIFHTIKNVRNYIRDEVKD